MWYYKTRNSLTFKEWRDYHIMWYYKSRIEQDLDYESLINDHYMIIIPNSGFDTRLIFCVTSLWKS
jgi:hypothetical protein